MPEGRTPLACAAPEAMPEGRAPPDGMPDAPPEGIPPARALQELLALADPLADALLLEPQPVSSRPPASRIAAAGATRRVSRVLWAEVMAACSS